VKRASIVILIALVAAVAARVAEPAHQRQAGFSAALACGVERWSVKTTGVAPNGIEFHPVLDFACLA
jgi:hypothetical protein